MHGRGDGGLRLRTMTASAPPAASGGAYAGGATGTPSLGGQFGRVNSGGSRVTENVAVGTLGVGGAARARPRALRLTRAPDTFLISLSASPATHATAGYNSERSGSQSATLPPSVRIWRASSAWLSAAVVVVGVVIVVVVFVVVLSDLRRCLLSSASAGVVAGRAALRLWAGARGRDKGAAGWAPALPLAKRGNHATSYDKYTVLCSFSYIGAGWKERKEHRRHECLNWGCAGLRRCSRVDYQPVIMYITSSLSLDCCYRSLSRRNPPATLTCTIVRHKRVQSQIL